MIINRRIVTISLVTLAFIGVCAMESLLALKVALEEKERKVRVEPRPHEESQMDTENTSL